LEGKIQVVQLRRVLLLFALVLGLSAVVASLAPPPDEENEGSQPDSPTTTVLTTPEAKPRETRTVERVRFTAPDPADRSFKTPTRLVPRDVALSVIVEVPEPGDVVLDGLGLRQSAEPLSPAHFELLASPGGRWAVLYIPVRGETRLIGRLQFGGSS
jgi:hypothetical protein